MLFLPDLVIYQEFDEVSFLLASSSETRSLEEAGGSENK